MIPLCAITHKLFYAISMKELSQHIASLLKSLRKERGWSLDKASQETRVSKAMLGQIEREESSPTVATLWKIANGFNLSFSAFLVDLEANRETSINRPRPGILNNPDEKIHVMSLFPFDPQLKCEIFVIDLLPHSEHLSLAHEQGVIEHIIVLKGNMEILIENNWHALQEGDALRFNAAQAHGYRNTTSQKVRFYNLIHYLQG